jgi:uncharacterized protein involved in exopolysaccharide biosynthesis
MLPIDPSAATAPLALSFTTRDLVLIIFRFRYRVLAAFLFCVSIAVALSLLVQPVYQSEASILINKLGREFTFRPDLSIGAPAAIPVATDPEEILNTQVQLMRSRDVILATIERMGLERLYPKLVRPGEAPDIDMAIEKFGDALQAVPQRTSNIVHVAFRNPDRALAAATLEALIQIFSEKSINVYINTQTRFYEEQLAQARDRFIQADQKLTAFRQRFGAAAFEAQMALLLQQRVNLDSERKKAAADLIGAADRAQALRQSIQQTQQEVTAFVDTQQNRVVDDARTKLLNLKLRQQEIAANYAPNSRQVQQVEREIAVAEQFLAQQIAVFSGTVRRARNDVLTALETDLSRALADRAGLEGRHDSISTHVADIDAQIDAITANETERWSLEMDVAAARDTLKAFMAKLEEARAAESLNQGRVGNIAIVQSPSLPDPRKPVHPKPLLYCILGVVAGLFFAIVVALLSELASDTIYDPVRTERLLNIPTLAVFNFVAADARSSR